MTITTTTLVLIRHGQASYGAADYDRLSSLGERQSRRVGERMAREQPRVAAIYCGPRLRHLQTAQLLIESARAAGVDYPDAVEEGELDELPVRELLLAALPTPGEELLGAVVDRVRRWAMGELAPPGVIRPQEFVARIDGALKRLAPPDGQVALFVTSGGPIAVPLIQAGAIGDVGEALGRGLQLANGSVTELRLVDGTLTVVPNQPVAHLSPDEITRI